MKIKTKLLCLFLVVLMVALTPMQIFAEETVIKKLYIKELLMVEGDKLDDYKKDDNYMVYDQKPIYKNTNPDDVGKVSTELYLVAELTSDPAEAITDIKALQMNDPFSFEEFKSFLQGWKSIAEIEAEDMLAGPILTFRAAYAQGQALAEGDVIPENVKAAQSAYQLLNCFIDDNAKFMEKNGGQQIRLGDLFLNEKLLTKEVLTDILFMGNTDAVNVIRKALAIACSVNANGKTFLDYITDSEYAAYVAQNYSRADFESDAKKLLAGLDDFNASIGVYNEFAANYPKSDDPTKEPSPEKIAEFDDMLMKGDFGDTDNAEEVLKNYLTGNIKNNYELFYRGKEYFKLFSSITVSTITVNGPKAKSRTSTNSIPLYDLLIQENYTPKTKLSQEELDKQLLDELEYFVIALKEQGSGMFIDNIGLPTLITIAASDKAEYQTKLAELQKNEDKDVANYAIDGISVFYGVDSDIFADGMVAMSGKAKTANTEGDTSYAARNKKNENAKKFKNVYLYTCIGSGALSAASVATFFGYAGYVMNNYATWTIKPIEFASGGVQVSGFYSEGLAFKNLFKTEWINEAGNIVGVVKSNPGGLRIAMDTTVAAGKKDALLAFGDDFTPKTSSGVSVGIACGVTFVISLAAFAYSLAMYIKTEYVDLLTDAYKEIPAMICDHRTITAKCEGTNEDLEDSKYVYYYGVKNPNGVATSSLYPIQDVSVKDKSEAERKKLPENKGGVQDIYNWELYGPRQWVCLYTTKDSYVGMPIFADSLCFENSLDDTSKVTVRQFDNYSIIDLNAAFNGCFDSLKSENMITDASKYKKTDKMYLRYKFDVNAAGAQSAGSTAIGEFGKIVGSMVTSPMGVALMLGTLAIGLGGGIAIGNVSAKKKGSKKEND